MYTNTTITKMYLNISVACVTDETKPRYRLYWGLVSSATQANISVAFVFLDSVNRLQYDDHF